MGVSAGAEEGDAGGEGNVSRDLLPNEMEVVDAEPHVFAAAADRVGVVHTVVLRGAGVEHGADVLVIRKDSERLGGRCRCCRSKGEHGKNSEVGKLAKRTCRHRPPLETRPRSLLAREAKAARSLAEAISEREGTAGLHRLRGYRIKVRLNGRNPRAITGDRCTSFSCGADIPSGAKEAAEKLGISCEIGEKRPSGAKAHFDPVGFMRGLKPPPPSGSSFSAACKAPPILPGLCTD